MLQRLFFVALFSFMSPWILAQFSIVGYAPQLINQPIYLWKYEDFMSERLSIVQNTTVDARGIFRFKGQGNEIQKMMIGTDQQKGYLYTEPHRKYNIEFIIENPQNASYNLKEEIELTFLDLDSTDINYKILGFHAWVDDYLTNIYVEKDVYPKEFSRKIAIMKVLVAKDAKADTSDYFIQFMKYTMANDVDNLRFIGAPLEEDKYTLYLKDAPILYHSDYYMDYFKSFYDQFLFRLEAQKSKELFGAFASVDLNKSDSILSKCNYTHSPELRSLLRIYILKQALYDDFIPKSVILSNLLKISKESSFTMHQTIAKNLLSQISMVQIGSPFPWEYLQKDSIDFSKFKGKHIYLHAFNPTNTQCINEIAALKKLKNTYGYAIEFITLYVEHENLNETESRGLEQINWTKIGVALDDPIWKNLGIQTFPYYTLLDPENIVLASPALSPTPNGKYENIEKTFYQITKP